MDRQEKNADYRLPGWLPAAAVMVAILLLLRGVEGTLTALLLQLQTLGASFLGGPDAVRLVFLQTLPLALASGVIVYGVTAEKIRFESFGSLVVVSGIVLAGAWLGGALRDTSAPYAEAGPGGLSIDQTAGGPNLSPAPPPSPGRTLANLDWWAEPRLDLPRGAAEPLPLLPEANGAAGLVTRAGNQLLGYLVAYNPRLFVASLLAGGYLGWWWQQRLARWRAPLVRTALSDPTGRRQAA